MMIHQEAVNERLRTVSLPSRRSHGVDQQVASVAAALAERADELVDELAETIVRDAPQSGWAVIVPHDRSSKARGVNELRSILAAMATDADFDPAPPTRTGMDRARRKLALSLLMDGFRIGFRRLWDVLAEEASAQGVDGEGLRTLTKRLHRAEDLFMAALVAGYRDEQELQLLDRGSGLGAVMDALLDGRILDDWGLWKAANRLRLPRRGPFVVIAAAVASAGDEALPSIECKLRSIDVSSAWWQSPDVQVGIAHVKSSQRLDKVLALVSRLATNRVGVSAPFDDLRDTPNALHFAKVMMCAPAERTSLVSVFDGTILATAAVSAPELMVKSVGSTLDGFSDLTDDEREQLIYTFQVWVESDASVAAAAERLGCHRNTVRYRLHRIEKRTGRSLLRPRDVAELCLAFEVRRRLM
jgi:hypothetical protein